MKRQIFTFLCLGLVLSFVLYYGCNKDNPVSGPGQTVTQILTNGSIVPINHSQATGTMLVTDQNGYPISGLTNTNVSAVLKWGSDDHPLDSSSGVILITSNSQAGNNVAGAVTMDLSGSMSPPYGQRVVCMKNGVLAYINSMKSNDLTEIIKFSSIVEVVQPFTSDKDLLRTADTSVWSGEGNQTALYQSIYQGTNDVKLQPSSFVRTVVAFTDGGENNSTVTKSQMISNALLSGIPIYTIYLDYDTSNTAYRDMKNIADTTGGFNFWVKPDSCSNLTQIYNKISGQLVGSYSMTITWTGTLPAMGTVVRATITTTYNGLMSSFTRNYVIP
jgi:hypothetical protein